MYAGNPQLICRNKRPDRDNQSSGAGQDPQQDSDQDEFKRTTGDIFHKLKSWELDQALLAEVTAFIKTCDSEKTMLRVVKGLLAKCSRLKASPNSRDFSENTSFRYNNQKQIVREDEATKNMLLSSDSRIKNIKREFNLSSFDNLLSAVADHLIQSRRRLRNTKDFVRLVVSSSSLPYILRVRICAEILLKAAALAATEICNNTGRNLYRNASGCMPDTAELGIHHLRLRGERQYSGILQDDAARLCEFRLQKLSNDNGKSDRAVELRERYIMRG
ncbi:MAG: hypothetical protein R3A13_11745 [Bdellovibrionota bacterium]